MNTMKTTEKLLIPASLLAELEDALDNAANGIRDPETIKKACRDMDRMREETRKKVGTLDVAVDLIRQGRDEV
jgi:hypothetical protein